MKFNKKKPCHILYVEDEENPLVLNGMDRQPLLFSNYSQAKRHAKKQLTPEELQHIRFVNA